MCFTFLAAAGRSIGDSLVEATHVDRCRDLLVSGRIVLPSDLVVASSPQPDQIALAADAVPAGWKGMDIGPESSARFAQFVQQAGTVLWNGPMGMFEDARFADGTRAVAEAVANSPAFSVVGGGDTVAAVTQFGWGRSIDHVSTGGGATLEFVERGDLPGLKALRDSGGAQTNRTGTAVVVTSV
jgi:phosphoglycerate kinase